MVALTVKDLDTLPQSWRLTPVRGKAPYLKNWQQTNVSRASIAVDISKNKATGFGLLLGEPSGFIMSIDFDGQSAIDFAHEKFGDLPNSVKWTSGKIGRFQVLYQVPFEYVDRLKTKRLGTGTLGEDGKEEGIEFRYTGTQSVLPPSKHPETGSYQWINGVDVPVATLPESILKYWLELIEPTRASVDPPVEPVEIPPNKPKPASVYIDAEVKSLRPIPIERCLSRQNRDRLGGVGEGSRDNTAIAIARDLIGVLSVFPHLTFDYNGENYRCDVAGDPYTTFVNFCNQCSPPLINSDIERIWASAQSYPPTPAVCGKEYQLNILRSWAKECLGSQGKTKQDRAAEKMEKYKLLAKELGLNLGLDEDNQKIGSLNMLKMDLYNMFGSRLEFNEMTRDYELDRKPIDINFPKVFIAAKLGRDYSTENCISAIHAVASRHPYHPVKEYLLSLEEVDDNSSIIIADWLHINYPGLENFDLLNNLATVFLGNSEPLANKMLRKKLIGAVARVLNPGVKDDTLLVLQGKQGVGKSSFLSALAGIDWFNDDLRDLENKDELAKLARFWILELAEVDYLFSKKEVEQFKRFLSATTDTFRPPYGRANVTTKRTCSFFASTNKTEFLHDPTGDRRYWVVEVKKNVDVQAVKLWRNVIWRLALDAYCSGENWWLECGDEDARVQSHQQYRETDPWLDLLSELPLTVGQEGEWTTTAAIYDKLSIPTERRDRRTSNRISKILTEMGFAPKVLWCKDLKKTHKVWWRESLPNLPTLPNKKKIGNEQNYCTEPVLPNLPNLPNINVSKKDPIDIGLSIKTVIDSEDKKNAVGLEGKLGKESKESKVGSESQLPALPIKKEMSKVGELSKEMDEAQPKRYKMAVGDCVVYVGGMVKLQGKRGKVTKILADNRVLTDFDTLSIPCNELELLVTG